MIHRLLLFLPFIIFSSCEVEKEQKLEKRNWQLTWSDEFDGDKGQRPDPSKWSYDIGRGQDGWGNQEFQYYTDSPNNVSLDGEGNLVITANNIPFSGANFTSGRIKTEGLFAQAYGRFEARLITPYGPGIWPAFWMLGSNINEVGWPRCGEIDIFEMRGQNPSVILSTLHGPGYSGGNSVSKSFTLMNDRFDSRYNIFAVEWDEHKVDFFINDFLYNRIQREDLPGEWVYNQPFFLVLNVAVGGNFVGFPTNSTPFPQRMIIDYIRVYKEVK